MDLSAAALSADEFLTAVSYGLSSVASHVSIECFLVLAHSLYSVHVLVIVRVPPDALASSGFKLSSI